MKILITTDLFVVKTNGVVTSVTNLADELSQKGHDVRILTLSENSESSVQDNEYYVGSFSMNRVYPGVRGTVAYRDDIIDEIIEWNPDVIHSQCEFFTFQFAERISKRCGAPIVHTYHTLYEEYAGYVGVRLAIKKVVKTLSRFRLRTTSAVIVPSQKVYNILKDYGIKSDLFVIPSGISIEEHLEPYTPEQKSEFRKSYAISDDTFVLISLGRLGKEKNIDELLLGFSRVLEKHHDSVLLIVGDGPERNELEDWVIKHGLENNVIFTGAVSPNKVHAYYQIADAFVSASVSETQGLVYIEAAANGLPLICRRDPCLTGVLDENENGNSYVTIDGFVDGCMKCIEDSDFKKSASAISRKNALKFSKNQFADKVEEVYKYVLEEK